MSPSEVVELVKGLYEAGVTATVVIDPDGTLSVVTEPPEVLDVQKVPLSLDAVRAGYGLPPLPGPKDIPDPGPLEGVIWDGQDWVKSVDGSPVIDACEGPGHVSPAIGHTSPKNTCLETSEEV